MEEIVNLSDSNLPALYAAAPKGSPIARTAPDGTVYVYPSGRTGKTLRIDAGGDAMKPLLLAWSANGRYCAAAFHDTAKKASAAVLVDAETGVVRRYGLSTYPVFVLPADDGVLACSSFNFYEEEGAFGNFDLYDAEGKYLTVIENGPAVQAALFINGGKTVAFVRVWSGSAAFTTFDLVSRLETVTTLEAAAALDASLATPAAGTAALADGWKPPTDAVSVDLASQPTLGKDDPQPAILPPAVASVAAGGGRRRPGRTLL